MCPGLDRVKVDEKSNRGRRLQESELSKMPHPVEQCRFNGAGRKVISEELESKLVYYVTGLREKRFRVTHKRLRKEAKLVFDEMAAAEPENFREMEFHTSVGWRLASCDRHDLTI